MLFAMLACFLLLSCIYPTPRLLLINFGILQDILSIFDEMGQLMARFIECL